MGWNGANSWIANVDDLEGGPIYAVEDYEHEEKPPCWCAREEVGVDAARVLEHEAKGGFVVTVLVLSRIDEAEEFEHAPEN